MAETDDDVGDDGLPIDPVKRRAAVVAQFDDIKAARRHRRLQNQQRVSESTREETEV